MSDIDLTGNVADMGDDDIGIRNPNLHSAQFKALLRRQKGEEARADEGEDMARQMYGFADDAAVQAHIHSHHFPNEGGTRNAAQAHARYHIEYGPHGKPHDH